MQEVFDFPRKDRRNVRRVSMLPKNIITPEFNYPNYIQVVAKRPPISHLKRSRHESAIIKAEYKRASVRHSVERSTRNDITRLMA